MDSNNLLGFPKKSGNELILSGGNGCGSTGFTAIRRFAAVIRNTSNDDFTYQDAATFGTRILINRSGWYLGCWTDASSSSAIVKAFTVNTTETDTSYDSINSIVTFGAPAVSPTNSSAVSVAIGYLNRGDVVRPHGSGSEDLTDSHRVRLTFCRLGE